MTSSGIPIASSGGEISSAIAGSARKPMARLVTVMPTWAPESCVDSERSAASTPMAPESPSAASCSTRDRSTVTNANSAATKTPHATMSTSETASRIQAVIGRTRMRAGADEEGRPCAARVSFGYGEGDSCTVLASRPPVRNRVPRVGSPPTMRHPLPPEQHS